MPTFEFTSPDGQKYEIEGPEGATEDQAFQILMSQLGEQPQQPTQPQQLPIGERISQGVQQRLANIQQTAQTQFGPQSGPLNPQTPTPFATTALSAAGNLAAIPLDIVGEGISEILPESVKQQLQQLGQTNPVQAVSRGVQQLEQRFPTQMQEAGNIANIGLLATPAKAGNVGQKLARSGRKASVRNKRSFVEDLITDPAKDIDDAIFRKGKVQFQLKKQQKLDAAQVSRIKGVSPRKNIIQNREAIKQANSKVISDLDNALKNSTARINTQGLNNFVDSAVNGAIRNDLLLDQPATAAIRKIGDAMKQAIAEHPNTPKGLWEARKAFDAKISAAHPTVYDNLFKPYNHVVQQVRQTINNTIGAAVPNKRIRGMLTESHHYFNALNRTKKKAVAFARSEGGKTTMRKAMEHVFRFALSPTVRAGAGAGAGVTALISGYPAIGAALLGGTAILTGGKVAKSAFKAPLTRQVVGEAINLIDKIGNKGLRAQRAALVELYENLEEQNGN